MSQEVRNIVVVGGTNIDDVIILDQAMPSDAKVDPVHSDKGLGGGGANSAIGIKKLARIFGDNRIDVTLITKIGHASEKDFVQNALAHNENITLMDAIENRPSEIPHNTVVSHAAGRAIFRRKAFNHAAVALSDNADTRIEQAVAKADLVLIQTKHARIAQIAADAAKPLGVPVVVDFSNQECPDMILDAADYALLPAEFRFTDMPDNANEDDLLSKVSARVPYAAISDANKNTRRIWDGEESSIESLSVTTRDSLGAGDLRDAAFCFFLMRDDDPDIALRKANIIASISCEYYGRTWESDLAERLKDFPEFDQDLGIPELSAEITPN